jgi:serine protease Do
MSDPLRNKLKIVVYTSLALVLALGLAPGFRWIRGGEAVTPAAAQSELVATSATVGSDVEPTQATRIPANYEALAEASRALVSIVDAAKPAVVSIISYGTLQQQRLPRGFEDLFGETHPQIPDSPFDAPLGRGSGFVVSEDGLIMTNNHVVAMAERIEVELSDGREFPAKLIGRDPTTDIALIKIDAEGLPAVRFGDSEEVAVGEFVVAIGNPGTALGSELPFTVTAGIVSAKGRNTRIIQQSAQSNYAIEDMIQTDAVINPGNSGGPLVNYRGEVIGINTAIQSTTGFYQGYGFAIPISLARDVMDDLLEYGYVRRAALRVSVTAPSRDDAKAFGLPDQKGAVVQDFTANSPAQKAGIEAGDVIVAIDDNPVERVAQLQRTVASYEPGDKVDVKVIRYGKAMSFTVKLAEAELPRITPTTAEVAGQPGDMLIGIEVSELSPRVFEQAWGFVPEEDLKGVMVTNVKRFGPAANAGLVPPYLIRKVNGENIENVQDFDRALSSLEAGDVVSVQAVLPLDTEGNLQHRIINMTVPERD